MSTSTPGSSTGTPHQGTVTVDGDASRVELRRRYGTDGADLWDAITSPERARRWLGALSGDLRAGGTYELRMGEGRPGADDVAHGEVLRCEPPRLLELTWHFPGEQQSHLRVEVSEDGELVLLHTRLEAAAARDYGTGWQVVLDQLEDDAAHRPVRPWGDLWARYAPGDDAAG